MATRPISITVDNDFARFGGKSYAINKINSVEVRERQPHGVLWAVIAGLIGIGCFLGGLKEAANGSYGSVEVGVFLLGVAFWLWQRSRVREYLLFLMTSSSETQAFVTRDAAQADDLRDQIESAMARHSQRGFGG